MGILTDGLSLVRGTGHSGETNETVFVSTNVMLRVDLWSIDGWSKRRVNAIK